MAVLIGSRALKYLIPRYRKCNDYDIIISKNEFDQWISQQAYDSCARGSKQVIKVENTEIECEFDELQSNKIILNRQYERTINIHGLQCWIADIQLLLAIKHSHRYYPINWYKNIKDYSFLKKMISMTPELLQLSEIRQNEKNVPKAIRTLSISNESFFEGSQKFVRRLYQHDDLHYATCYYNQPLWSKCKNDHNKAAVSYRLFEQLSNDDKIKMIQEEAFVIALERKIIPFEEDPNAAFRWAIMRISTDLTGGWFREFAVENHVDVMKHNHDYVSKFREALSKGLIREYHGA